ncbi:MAG: lipoyl synthase [Candidatus Margulisiibacteriota bacterium]|nr:MAG: lipoyl synthase [Candidatus Margulisbacteria bacterium GWE2_39_32]PZM78748.1 MAG: lipoyl synthase [Candidatus Margulisiibacteriota bacterium]HCT85407.1 lipoyl synthase [Candidatus Margulisiibacteriota bacterium]HCY36427.1 lipoyl synthase [Candidatus Margulisiibacteriota bacterium]
MGKLPEWLKTKTSKGLHQKTIRSIIDDQSIHTVCESAKCPNRGECFSKKTVTFMILGDVCTRNCAFCAVSKGIPKTPEEDEPQHLINTIVKLGLKYIVITSVTRDDLPDGGASHFAKIISAIKSYDSTIKIEILTPDFQGNYTHLSIALDAQPDVFNHNIETVPRLYPLVRSKADYNRSLRLLKYSKEMFPNIVTKSGLMVGLGETIEEIKETLKNLSTHLVDIVTIGQYLQPSSKNVIVHEYIHPDIFEDYKSIGKTLGLKVVSAPFVRSSYNALEVCNEVLNSDS